MSETRRLEAFSDGVLAIAITLLVLDLTVPTRAQLAVGGRTLGQALAAQWPSYAAYVVSFLTIGVIWINHHAMLRRLVSVDHTLLMLNLLLLMFIGVLPFTTSLMAAYLRSNQGQHHAAAAQHLAAGVYAGSFAAMALAFYAMQHHALSRRVHLLQPGLDRAARRVIDRRNRAGVPPYFVAIASAPLSSYLTLGICGAIAVFYALPNTTSDGAA